MALIGTITGYAKGESGPRPIVIREEVTGLSQVMDALSAFGDRAPRELARALHREAERIMRTSKQEVPVDTGALRDSGYVEPATITAAGVEVILGYGGAAIPYALRQHEELSYAHTVGKAKYLEDPWKAAQTDMDERLALELRARLERTSGRGG